jgi:hypothetical protein
VCNEDQGGKRESDAEINWVREFKLLGVWIQNGMQCNGKNK